MPLRAAELLAQHWLILRERFDELTRRAAARFEARDWQGMQSDAVERLGLYRRTTDAALAELRRDHGPHLTDRALWPPLKQAFSSCIAGRADRLLAETFLNSITRRVFATVGVDPGIEFVDSDFDLAPAEAEAPLHQTLVEPDADGLVRRILGRLGLAAPWSAFDADARAVARVIEAAAGEERGGCGFEAQVLPMLFYRNQGAYVVGRLKGCGGWRPLILALLHRPDGLMVDAALVDEDDAARVFSFTRSYFQVEVERPVALVDFLHALMPGKRVHELWTSLGFNKHGKTELYRHLLQHLRESSDSFRHAPGQRGLVMAVFTLASCDVAFKVIRDHIQRPKEIGREHVMAKYQLVFQHDRAGRLVDAQEFEHLRLRAPALRARAARGLPLPRAAAATRRRRGDGRRGLVLRGRAGHLPRGVPALHRPRGKAARGVPGRPRRAADAALLVGHAGAAARGRAAGDLSPRRLAQARPPPARLNGPAARSAPSRSTPAKATNRPTSPGDPTAH